MMRSIPRLAGLIGSICLGAGCASNGIPVSELGSVSAGSQLNGEYRIGPGDQLSIFVWQNPDISVTVPVRPDGRISTPLVRDMQAVGRTPTELEDAIELVLAEFIRTPEVSVIVLNFVGTFDQQIRVVGGAAQPQALPYREGVTVLDVVIAAGGLNEFASGNRARLIRQTGGEPLEIRIRLDDLMNEGDMRQNVLMQPGDVLIIPESFF